MALVDIADDDALKSVLLLVPFADRTRARQVSKGLARIADSQDLWGTVDLTKDNYSMGNHKTVAHILHEALRNTTCGPTSINLSGCLQISDQTLRIIATNCPHLLSLHLSGTTGFRLAGITDDGVGMIAEGCPRLEQLSLKRCDRLRAPSVESLARVQLPLRHLDLSGNFQLTSDAMVAVGQLSGLETLSLAGCHGIDFRGAAGSRTVPPMPLPLPSPGANASGQASGGSGGFAELGNLTALRSLNASGLIWVSDSAVAHVLDRLGDTLTSLDLSGCRQITDAALLAVSKCCGVGILRSLTIGHRGLVLGCHGGLQHMVSRHGPALEKLSLQACRLLSRPAMATLAQSCQQLEELDLFNCGGVSDACLHLLAASPALEHLCVLRLGSSDIRHSVTDRALSAITQNTPQLQVLDLQGCDNLSVGALQAALSHCPLRRLNLWGIGCQAHQTSLPPFDTLLQDLVAKPPSGPLVAPWLQDLFISRAAVTESTARMFQQHRPSTALHLDTDTSHLF